MSAEAGKTPSAAAAAAADKRAPFELLAFTAAPVAGALVVVELEGRFASQGGRFTRRPVLVVEAGDHRPRLELAPVRATADDGRWRSAYAIPAEAFPGARFALGLRGTLLELPAPDEPGDADRFGALAREANALRRALEAAEAEAAATSADLGAAVSAARDEAADRIATLEADLAEAHRTAAEEVSAAHQQALAEATARADAAEQRAAQADARTRAAQDDAEARAQAAEEAAQAAAAGTDVLRAELAEERERSRAAIADLEAELDAARRRADAAEAPPPAAIDEDATQPLAADTPATLPGRRARVVGPTSTHTTAPRGPGPWIAVGALVLFAFVLLGLLVGFLG